MRLDGAEAWTRAVAGVVGLAVFVFGLVAMFMSLRRASGREEGTARVTLRLHFLIVATSLFVVSGILLWQPLSIQLQSWLRVTFLFVGSLLFLGGLALYLWGMRSLGRMFGPSTGFGVRLQAGHRLITTGAYAHVRHPMYLAVIVTAIGSLLLYRTWATLAFAICMVGLLVRARREERILAEEFGTNWEAYASQVPGWFPRLRRWRARSGPAAG